MDFSLETVSGRYWRSLSVLWQHRPFESGSHKAGGRWNSLGTPALYLSADHATAIEEMHQGLVQPCTVIAFDVEASAIADLRLADPAITQCLWREIFGIKRKIPPSWVVAERLIASEAEGALVPSVQHRGGTNLVLWRWHAAGLTGAEGAALTLIDPHAVLSDRGRG